MRWPNTTSNPRRRQGDRPQRSPTRHWQTTTHICTREKPPRTSFFAANGFPGPPDHNGVVDALRKIGDPGAAAALLDYLKDAKTDDLTRPLAIDGGVAQATEFRGKAGMEMPDRILVQQRPVIIGLLSPVELPVHFGAALDVICDL